ncbi:MAG: glycosyltransferase family 2 protein [Muribaculum sp.]|nr:glycosyltransferase family 2 protein [Muribaculum sp.]
MPHLLSIVMPAYNASPHIGDAILSLQRQTYADWELIVVDDLSTDSTCRKVADFAVADPRISLVRRKVNSGGAFIPRTEAVSAASGEFIVELDADDLFSPDYLQVIADRIAKTGAEVVFGNMTFMHPDGSLLPLTSGAERNSVVAGRDFIIATLDGWRDGCKGAIKRDLYLRSCQSPEIDPSSMSADELLTRIILLNADKVAFSDPTYYYRVNPKSITQRRSIQQFDILDTDLRLRRIIYAHFAPGSDERRRMNDQSVADLWSCLREYAAFKFRSGSDRRRVREMIMRAYKAADISTSSKRMGLRRTLALMAGPSAVINTFKLLNAIGKGKQRL